MDRVGTVAADKLAVAVVVAAAGVVVELLPAGRLALALGQLPYSFSGRMNEWMKGEEKKRGREMI